MKGKSLLIVFLISILFSPIAFSQQNIAQTDKEQIIDEICTLLREHYVYPEIAETIIDSLQNNLKNGRYHKAKDNDVFSDLLTEDLQSVNQDLHLKAWSLRPRGDKSEEEPDWPEIFLNYISDDKKDNYGFISVQRFDGNIGYLELTKLKQLNSESKRIVKGAMDFLSNSDALIIDLRKNTGGHPEMIEFITSYFFEDRVQLTGAYQRVTGGIQESWTLKDFYNKKMVDIPLFILISKKTISAPEGFTYNLQTLKRATVVGEVTKGAANPGRFFRIKEMILLLVATGYAENPITKTSWEGVGIKPDIEISAEEALNRALKVAKESAKTYREKKDKELAGYIERLQMQIEEVEKLVEKDVRLGEELLNQVTDEWFGKEFINRFFFLEMGSDYRKKNNTKMAILVYKQIPRFYPEYITSYRKLADTYLSMGDNTSALRYLTKVLELNPNDKVTLQKINSISGTN